LSISLYYIYNATFPLIVRAVDMGDTVKNKLQSGRKGG